MADRPLVTLHSARNRYGPEAREAKLASLTAVTPRSFRSAQAVSRYHDDLLFLAAFPDDPEVLQAVWAALNRLPRFLSRSATRSRLVNTGIVRTTTSSVLSATMVRCIQKDFPESIGLDWSALGTGGQLDPIIRHGLHRAEEDGFDAVDLSTRDWIRHAMAGHGRNELEWLLTQRPGSPLAGRRWDALFDEAELTTRWELPPEASATHLRLSFAPRAFRLGFRRPSVVAPFTTRTPETILLDPAPAREAIQVARFALATRGREVHAITEANDREVYLADLGQGVSLLLIGADHHARMTLEANYGYLLLANGIPIGYGGVTPLYRQANTGINIFPAFRKSEASAIFARALHVFTALFAVRRFVVNPYQFGRDNPEAIASGAYWFYHRLGFEATDPELRRLAEWESKRQQRSRSYRTDRATLRQLAAGDLTLTLPGAAKHRFLEERLLARWSQRVSIAIGERAAGGSRRAAHRRLIRETADRLGASGRRGWTRSQSEGFAHLVPVVAMLSLERWTPAERRSLLAILRAKGSDQERDFVLASQKLPRLWRDLTRLGD